MDTDTPYPAGPTGIPPQLTQATPIYKRRAWFAVAGLMLFVLLYLLFAGWFAYTAYKLFASIAAGNRNILGVGLVGACAAFLAIFMLKALFFIDRSDLSGNIEITADQHPRLFEFLHRLADEAGAPRPYRVFLSPQVNAAVFYDLSFLNLIWPSKKNLEIGLGLLNILTLGEFKAVCAHEFGHFAQRTMAVGRWVYVAQRIAGNIVAKRDALDRFLDGLSNTDLRIAWIGWLLKLIVWSIRSLMDSVFSVVVLAQRALSREMEMQADRVAVSLTGSDALVHALYRLQAADDAWERTLSFISSEAHKQRAVSDVFAVQSRLLKLVGVFLNDPAYRKMRRPENNPQAHRIFEPELAQPPRMWSTHPFNHEREENAKRIYLAAPLDERSSWELFDAPQKVCEEMSAHLLRGYENLQPTPIEETLRTLEEAFQCESLRPFYRGVYLGRSAVRHAAHAEDLYDMKLPADAGALAMLYPENLSHELEQLRRQEKEVALLKALRDGHFTPPDGIIRHRGRRIPRRRLPAAIAAAQKELQALREKIETHDRHCRSLHRHAAIAVGHGWEAYLVGLARTLHYATHREADLLDAQGHLGNTLAVTTATRKVSKSGLKRILKASEDTYETLAAIYAESTEVALDETLRRRLGNAEQTPASWTKILGEFELVAPDKDNINEWINVIDGWIGHTAGRLDALKDAALEQLLASEREVARHWQDWQKDGQQDANDIPDAPAPSRVPQDYAVLLPDAGRKRQTRLGFWARFQTADGIVPTLTRLAAACLIVVPVLGFGSRIGEVDLTVYNGLARTVEVRAGEKIVTLPPYAASRLDLPGDKRYHIETRIPGGATIESFDEILSAGGSIYNIAGASALVRAVAVYGDARPESPQFLGAPRWVPNPGVDLLFQEPPSQIKMRKGSSGATRSLIQGAGDLPPETMREFVTDENQRIHLIATHARWDDPAAPNTAGWLSLARSSPEFAQIVKARLEDNPRDAAALNFKQ